MKIGGLLLKTAVVLTLGIVGLSPVHADEEEESEGGCEGVLTYAGSLPSHCCINDHCSLDRERKWRGHEWEFDYGICVEWTWHHAAEGCCWWWEDDPNN